MIKMLFSSLALAFVAFSANAMAPRAAHADACSDLQAVIQNPLGGTGGAAAADAIKARAQTLSTLLCPNGAAADATAPTQTPAQLAAANTPSACPAYSDPPMPAAGATHAQIRSSVPAFNTWAAANATSQTCHHDEVTKAQRETAIYDAAVLIWQQHLTQQVMQLQANFDQQRTAFMRAQGNQH
jgi:hypothetical protein